MKIRTSARSMSVEMLVSQVKRNIIRPDHPLQRAFLQWTAAQKGDLIARILDGLDIASLKICIQSIAGFETQWLIDGKQRVGTVMEFLENGFKIPASCRYPYVEYQGFQYETTLRRGKEVYKKDKNGNFIVAVDESGNEIHGNQVIDIRGRRFSDLPPELQEEFKTYIFDIVFVSDCNDKTIQREIIDVNSGTKMNPAQLGMNRLGNEWAQSVIELKDHPFILNCAGFKPSEEKNGKIERAITESLALILFPDEWKKNYTELCDFLSENLISENVRYIEYMFNTLEQILADGDYREGLESREFFVMMANFAHFLESNYDIPNYAEFLRKWIDDLRYIQDIEAETDDGEVVFKAYVEEYETGTKAKPRVLARLEYINDVMDRWLADNGTVSQDDAVIDRYVPQIEEVTENIISEEAIDDFVEEFNNIPIISSIQEKKDVTALCSLMMVSNAPQANFHSETISDFSKWFKKYGNTDNIDACIDYAEFLNDSLKEIEETEGIDIDNDIFDKYNMPIMISMVKRAYDEDICRSDFIAWLKDTITSYNEEDDYYKINMSTTAQNNSCIVQKISMLSNKLTTI